ncbi:hypothetical protein [Nostoc sp. ChiQUE01b]|uniref:hypothetical protein n=1 Tax=Nostoc sp. ChiQUE01b TaxID=3075376 RepID=UPI002AD489F9|nr:hypothetical protein [Nostoc sp. ChiQUE01b]MDZ8264553.1 hypothetical protein [Nostoc sp. ChiQUE01b]
MLSRNSVLSKVSATNIVLTYASTAIAKKFNGLRAPPNLRFGGGAKTPIIHPPVIQNTQLNSDD